MEGSSVHVYEYSIEIFRRGKHTIFRDLRKISKPSKERLYQVLGSVQWSWHSILQGGHEDCWAETPPTNGPIVDLPELLEEWIDH